MTNDTTSQSKRRWRTIRQIAERYKGSYTEPAIRGLVHRSKAHYNSKGEWVEGNGLALSIAQPGGKNGKVLIDEIGFELWLESWAGDGIQAPAARCTSGTRSGTEATIAA